MKQVKGIWLPDSDTHFEAHLNKGPEFQGAGTYQLKKIEMALAQVKKRDTAIDIGAHVGLWSRVLAPNFVRVIAFEPVREHINCFHKNLGHVPNVTLIPIALGNYTGGDILINPTPDNTGNAHVDTNAKASGERAVIDRLDAIALVKDARSIDFIKIDVEGYELEVVKGAEQTIKKHKPVMVIEQKPGHGQRYGFGERAAVDLVLTWGAKIAWIKAGDCCLVWK
jgi:FkbM family methyltransferase